MTREEEIRTRCEAAINNIRKFLPPKQDMMDLIGSADGTPFGRGQYPVWTDPEPYAMDEAANCIEALLDENARLQRKLVIANDAILDFMECIELGEPYRRGKEIAERHHRAVAETEEPNE